MPSELTNDPQKTINQEIFFDQHPISTQHGLLPHDCSTLPPVHSEESAESRRTAISDDSSVETSRLFKTSSDDASVAGLKRVYTPPHGRITEYENAPSPSTSYSGERRLFQVIQTSQQPDDEKSPILRLPNGTRRS
jgi:hypothetical protein